MHAYIEKTEGWRYKREIAKEKKGYKDKEKDEKIVKVEDREDRHWR